MWVQFLTKPTGTGSFTLTQYQVDGEDPVPLPESVSTGDTIKFIIEKAKTNEADIAERGTVKVNMKLTEFQARILPGEPTDAYQQTSTPASQVPSPSVHEMMAQLIALQRQQAEQQQLLLQVVAVSTAPRPSFELVKPDVFDGVSASPVAWLNFFEYASEKNGWTADEEKIKNMRLFLRGMAKSWYELRIPDHVEDAWKSWKDSFLTSFQENAVDRWDRALTYKYRGGSTLEYFFEKRRLLQMADPCLPESSIVPLVIHGMTKDLQRQVQIKSPATIEGLLQCCREICHEPQLAPQGVPRSEYGQHPAYRRGNQPTSWRQPNASQSGGLTGAGAPVQRVQECRTPETEEGLDTKN